MKIPYGESNFKKVITGGYVYIDKTAYIAQLETAGSYHFLLRPRRFGKSLFVSMLWHYYDMAHQHEFEALFGKLYIGQYPTPLKNSYQVLLMDFSGIATATPERVYEGFAASVNTSLGDFLHRYGYAPEVFARISGKAAPEEKIRIFFEAVKMAGQKILLLIDEYDHFANTLLAEDLSLFQCIMGKGGFVRSFYEVLKSATMTGVLDRLFVTGVTPLMLDSLTSGFNIAENLSIHAGFNAAMGFTHLETQGLLQPLADQCGLETDTLMADVTDWYNGYRFHVDANETVFYSDMVLYFAKHFDRDNCTYPKRMLDENIASDYRKIMALFQIGDRDANYQVLNDLINNGDVLAVQQRKFELDKHFDRNDFISLLAYMGFVTISGETMTQTRFAIPNHVIRELYFQYFKVELEQRNQLKLSNQTLPVAIETLALQGDLQPLAVEMQQVLAGLSNRDLIKLDEKHIKTLLLTLLYQFPIYFIHSEREMDKKYPDVLLLERSPFAVKYQNILKKAMAQPVGKPKSRRGLRRCKVIYNCLQLPPYPSFVLG
ncbi:AAA family ATPase [Candidatus Thiothrix anitrata]|uniref:AAA family ATPase n=1 Tax=Candidatus Thiothrix anitrata TaxID=2823902 RepID=UPI002B1BDF8F|nr:AAA family ATPase [Candidatus Thiothrix anitrata]